MQSIAGIQRPVSFLVLVLFSDLASVLRHICVALFAVAGLVNLGEHGLEVHLIEVVYHFLEVLAASLALAFASVIQRRAFLLVRFSENVTSVQDGIEDASNAENRKQGVAHGDGQHHSAWWAVVLDALQGKSIGHGAPEAGNPHYELLLTADYCVLSS